MLFSGSRTRESTPDRGVHNSQFVNVLSSDNSCILLRASLQRIATPARSARKPAAPKLRMLDTRLTTGPRGSQQPYFANLGEERDVDQTERHSRLVPSCQRLS